MTLPGDIGGASTNLELKEYGAEIRRLLAAEEHLLDLTDFRQADGKDQLERRPPGADTRSTGRKVAETTAGVVAVTAFGPATSPSLKRMLGGVSAAGHIGSWAHQLYEASRDLSKRNRFHYLLVTDRRLLLAGRVSSFRSKSRDYEVGLEIPRSALAQVDLDSRPFARGRVALAFTDGSMIAMDLGSYRTGAARTLVQALTSPGTVTPLPV